MIINQESPHSYADIFPFAHASDLAIGQKRITVDHEGRVFFEGEEWTKTYFQSYIASMILAFTEAYILAERAMTEKRVERELTKDREWPA